MATAKAFRPEFKTRNGKHVSFGANYTHNTAAKRRAGLTKAGRPKVETVGAGTVVRRPRRWIPWAVFGVNSVVIGGAWIVAELGPVVGGLVVGGTLWVGYRVVRWTAGEVAYFATKARQISGGQRADASEVYDLPPGVRVPGDKVSRPDDKK
ncbi:hypothetical protein [Streptomyces sp. VNUA24]|uniref:hypothetical protein n=1 Tax=Streptomyces sp. VNUA24 TaxID=3031131 RepID=UPI0023B7FE70|nr:hypothetical protein [Streptomyces sp. VNUA24]WEH15015.1 hypothetical protein PYR72_15295 [Streptomyces sp. VNUA24]